MMRPTELLAYLVGLISGALLLLVGAAVILAWDKASQRAASRARWARRGSG